MAAFTDAWEANGGTVDKNVPYNPEATSLNSEAQQIASGNPDGWMIIDYTGYWAKMGPALVRTGNWDPAKTFTGDGLRSPDLPGDAGAEATKGMRGTVPTSLDAPAGAQFDALWKAEVKQPRQTYDAQNFDAVMILSRSRPPLRRSSDPAAIAENLQAVTGPPGDKYTFETLQEAFDAAAERRGHRLRGRVEPDQLRRRRRSDLVQLRHVELHGRQARETRQGHPRGQ